MSGGPVYLNGRIVPENEARISVFDAGLLHGASAFTTMLARRGVVFRLDRHLKRLTDTAAALGMRTGATAESLSPAVGKLLRAGRLADARVRITLTPGDTHGGEPTTIITADALPESPREGYEKGVAAVLSPYRQHGGDPAYGNKTGCYFQRVLARQQAAAKGAEEALWFTADNRLAEACFCNVFLVLDGTVHTPPRDTPVLPGIVREAAIELCGELGIPCDAQTPLMVRHMLDAKEMFLTASCSGVRPVICVERHDVGEGKPGPVTRRILAAYRELLERECSASAGKGAAKKKERQP